VASLTFYQSAQFLSALFEHLAKSFMFFLATLQVEVGFFAPLAVVDSNLNGKLIHEASPAASLSRDLTHNWLMVNKSWPGHDFIRTSKAAGFVGG
jgi:hypothetical protein